MAAWASAGLVYVLAHYGSETDSSAWAGPWGGAATPVLFAALSVPIFYELRVHKRIWRFLSVRDLPLLAAASGLTVLSGAVLLAAAGYRPYGVLYAGAAMVVHWVTFLGFMLSGRVLWAQIARADGYTKAPERPQPVLLVEPGIECDLLLRGLESAAAPPFDPVGILDCSGKQVGRALRGVPILGSVADLPEIFAGLARDGRRPDQLIVTKALPAPQLMEVVRQADRLRLVTNELPSPGETRAAILQGVAPTKPIRLEALLGRPPLMLDTTSIVEMISGRRILVTGAGGSIGRQLVDLIAGFGPERLAILDNCEFNLWRIDGELRSRHADVRRQSFLADIRDARRLEKIFDAVRPEIIFHAAALKHVPMVEANPSEAVMSNVVGSRNLADLALRSGTRAMVQVSTDKAVNPSSIMGATKRLGELYCQALDLESAARFGDAGPRFMTVRFGNVLGSSGSVVPVFQQQIDAGGPVTVTHPEMTRYFMTIREACELVLHAGAHGLADAAERGMIYVLEMGDPVRIIEIARQMIRLNGKRPDDEIAIRYIGARPGEKLFEELFDSTEQRLPGPVEGVNAAKSVVQSLDEIAGHIDTLERQARRGEDAAIRLTFERAVPGYHATPQSAGNRVAA